MIWTHFTAFPIPPIYNGLVQIPCVGIKSSVKQKSRNCYPKRSLSKKKLMEPMLVFRLEKILRSGFRTEVTT